MLVELISVCLNSCHELLGHECVSFLVSSQLAVYAFGVYNQVDMLHCA